MASVFDITISATDKATATVRKVNDAFEKMTRPFKEAGKSFKRLGKELHLPAIGKGLANTAKAGTKATKAILGIAAPIVAITGATSLAGITALADKWSKFGRHVADASQGMGVTVERFQQMQQLGTLGGVGADAVTSSLHQLGTTMEDARWGRNQGALMLLNRLGVGLKQTKDGTWDVIGEMKSLAKVMTSPQLKNNPWAQELVANQLGLGAMLPILRQGEAGLARYEAMQKKLGYVSSPQAIANANRFAESLAGLKVSVEGLGQSIMDQAMPVLRPFVDGLAGWVARNRELISQNVAQVVGKVADYLGNVDWDAMGQGVTAFLQDAKDGLGAVKEIADAVVSVFRAIKETKDHLVTGWTEGTDENWVGALDDVQRQWLPGYGWLADQANGIAGSFQGSKEKAQTTDTGIDAGLRNRVIGYFEQQGWSHAQALGIAANLAGESHFNRNAVGDNGSAFGIAQWHGDRQAAFQRWKGHDIRSATLEEQLGFVHYELTQGREQRAGQLLHQATTPAEAAGVVSAYYERPKATEEAIANRGALADRFAQTYAPPTGLYGNAGTTPAAAPAKVELHVSTAPGVKAEVTQSDDNVSVKPRVGYSAVGGGVG